MRLSMPICCLSTVHVACTTLVASSTPKSESDSEDIKLLVNEDNQNTLDRRAVVAVDVTTAVAQATTITTRWMQSQLNPSSVTYVEVIYTQAFAKVPDQDHLPRVGSTGYGTLQEEKRDAAPTAAAGAGGKKGNRSFCGLERWPHTDVLCFASETKCANVECELADDASSFVLELQTLIHTVGVTPVYQVTELTEVEVDENGDGVGVSNGTAVDNTTWPAEMSPEYPP